MPLRLSLTGILLPGHDVLDSVDELEEPDGDGPHERVLDLEGLVKIQVGKGRLGQGVAFDPRH